MTSDDAVLAVIDALEALAVPYMVVGSFASNSYAIPRSTQDADFVIELGGRSVRDIAEQMGPAFHLDPQSSFESVTMTIRYELQVVGGSFKIELFLLSDDAHDQERFRRRLRRNILGRAVFLPTPEDVVITKLRWAVLARRSKDRDDAREVIAVQGEHLNWEYIHQWTALHGTRALLDEVRASIPPD